MATMKLVEVSNKAGRDLKAIGRSSWRQRSRALWLGSQRRRQWIDFLVGGKDQPPGVGLVSGVGISQGGQRRR